MALEEERFTYCQGRLTAAPVTSSKRARTSVRLSNRLPLICSVKRRRSVAQVGLNQARLRDLRGQNLIISADWSCERTLPDFADNRHRLRQRGGGRNLEEHALSRLQFCIHGGEIRATPVSADQSGETVRASHRVKRVNARQGGEIRPEDTREGVVGPSAVFVQLIGNQVKPVCEAEVVIADNVQ